MQMEQVKKCCERVARGRWTSGTCDRIAVKDGYCKIHHPDYAKAKRDAYDAKWKAYYEAKEQAYRARREEEAAKRLILQNAPVRVKELEDMVDRLDGLLMASYPAYRTSSVHDDVVKLLAKRGI